MALALTVALAPAKMASYPYDARNLAQSGQGSKADWQANSDA